MGGEHKVFDFMVIYFFKKYLLNTSGGPGTAQGAGNRAVKKIKIPVLHGTCPLVNFAHIGIFT